MDSDLDQLINDLFPQQRGGSLIRGVLIGAIVGAAGVALLAPRERELLRERALELKDLASELLRRQR